MVHHLELLAVFDGVEGFAVEGGPAGEVGAVEEGVPAVVLGAGQAGCQGHPQQQCGDGSMRFQLGEFHGGGGWPCRRWVWL